MRTRSNQKEDVILSCHLVRWGCKVKLDLSDGNPFRKESRNHTSAFAAKLGYVKVGFASNISKTGFSDQELKSFLNVIDCTFGSGS